MIHCCAPGMRNGMMNGEAEKVGQDEGGPDEDDDEDEVG